MENLMTIFIVTQVVKNLPGMQEMQVWSLTREDRLKEEMATHSSILAWEIRWAEEPGGLQPTWLPRVGHHWVTNTFTFSDHFHSQQICFTSRIHYYAIIE